MHPSRQTMDTAAPMSDEAPPDAAAPASPAPANQPGGAERVALYVPRILQQHLGADSLARWIEASDRSVARLVSRRGYRVLEIR